MSRTPLGRSLDVYYRDRARTARMDRLNAQFIRPGGLAFDIGAHLGDRTGSFRRQGARVVAVEPQPQVFRALRLLQGRVSDVLLVQAAVGAEAGEVTLHVNSRNPTVTTASEQFIEAAATAPEWQGQVWDRTIRVPMTTLDLLIAEHGRPDFVKIDVEGHEAEVLRGLTLPLPALSFEFTTIQRDIAFSCLSHLIALGPYQFNLSLGEVHALRDETWLTEPELRAILQALPDSANSGDIYARI